MLRNLKATEITAIDNNPKVLVVDDLKENHRVFNNILSDLNTEIVSASSGEEAVSLALRHQFAVILLDVMMPGMDGYETANLIRINEETKFTPIIFVTAMEPNAEYEDRGYAAGAVDYLFKPIKPQILVGKVNVFLELERQRHKIRQTLEDIQWLETRNELLLRSVGEGILGLDKHGAVTFSNPAAQRLLGYDENSLEHLNVMDIMCLSNTELHHQKWADTEVYRNCERGLGHHENIGVFWNKQKSLFPVEYLATPIREPGKQAFIGVVIAFQDVTERKKTEDRLAQLAQLDTLTGLYNRYAFRKQLIQSLARGVRHHSQVALLFIDLDKFKQVNDNLGHEAGDLLLQECANRLLACVREGDIISRIGGDEFTVILEDIDNPRNAAVVARKIISTFAQPIEISGSQVYIGASIGIATYPESATDADKLLRCSDIAMYKAKEAGRNGYQFFTGLMQKEVSGELALENSLRAALENDEFFLVYQPKVESKTGKVVGLEALSRWKTASGEYIPPDVFIRKAEEMGLIEQLGEQVLMGSCKQMCDWQRTGYFTQGETLAVNLSMRQLKSPDLIPMIQSTLDESGIAPSQLELEITESMMMQEPENIIQILHAVHRMGIQLAIDDFGTGYSSLSHLRQLPIDCLKIDKSFVQAITEPSGDAIVKAIISLGKNLGLKITAEGAETKEQVEFLTAEGADMIQGYYFSRPLSSEKMETFLKANQYQ